MKGKLGKFVSVVIYALSGVACGLMFGRVYDDTGNFVISFLTLIIGMYLGFILSIGIHEAGHLVFGLLSGYKFISYRLGNLMIIKKDGKLCLRRFSLAGTAGQCLMSPPEMKDGKIPCVNFNLGGAVFNFVAGAVFLAVSFCLGMNPVYGMIAAINIGTGLSNGIPLHLGIIDNDGMNAWSLRKDPAALEAFCFQLRVAGAQTDMLKLRDMPAEWFEMPSEDAIGSNTLIATKAVLIENRLMDEHRFDEALALAEPLCRKATVLELHKQLLRLDIASILFLKGRSDEALRILDEKSVVKAMKLLKVFPPCLRTKYIAAKLGGRGSDVAARLEFDRICKKYPYNGEIESERELMALADSVSGGEMR